MSSAEDVYSTHESLLSNLPYTGEDVIMIAIAGLFLIAVGFFIKWRIKSLDN